MVARFLSKKHFVKHGSFISQSLQERMKLVEDVALPRVMQTDCSGQVKVQQERLRQKLWEQRQLADHRLKEAEETREPCRERRESPEQTLWPAPPARGYVPREGTRQAEARRVKRF